MPPSLKPNPILHIKPNPLISCVHAAGPKSWRGVATAEEDWGELNTGKRSPAVYVLDARTKAVAKVGDNKYDCLAYV